MLSQQKGGSVHAASEEELLPCLAVVQKIQVLGGFCDFPALQFRDDP